MTASRHCHTFLPLLLRPYIHNIYTYISAIAESAVKTNNNINNKLNKNIFNSTTCVNTEQFPFNCTWNIFVRFAIEWSLSIIIYTDIVRDGHMLTYWNVSRLIQKMAMARFRYFFVYFLLFNFLLFFCFVNCILREPKIRRQDKHQQQQQQTAIWNAVWRMKHVEFELLVRSSNQLVLSHSHHQTVQ